MTFIALVPPIYYNVKQYGAVGDGKTVTDGAITTGTPTLTSASAAFTSTDVGKQITVNGAGASGANLNTTISAYVNATTITLAINAGTTVSAATVFYATDDTTAIANAYTAAKATGGVLFFPPGTYISGNIGILNNEKVFFAGAGIGVSILKLKNGANTDLISAYTANINLAATFGSGSSTGITTPWGIANMTLDGNKANQTSGTSYPLRYYGYGETFENIEVSNGYSGGILRDWCAASPNAIAGSWENVRASFNNGIGIQIGGPTDLKLNKIFPNNSGSHDWHIAPNAGALNATNCHVWAPEPSHLCLLVEASQCVFDGLECEGSNVAQMVILDGQNTVKGMLFGGTQGGAGIQIGQAAGNTPYAGQIFQSAGVTTARAPSGCIVDVVCHDITNANGSLWFANDGGNDIRAAITETSGPYLSGTPNMNTHLNFYGTGLTADGSQGKSSGFVHRSYAYSGGFTVGNPTIDIVNVDSVDGGFQMLNGSFFTGYSGNYTGVTISFACNTGNVTLVGQLATGQSATAAALASNGTITTANIGEARIAPTAAVTGIILQSGTAAGQEVVVVNESAFSVTFAAVATSHVADGVSAVIAANRCMFFKWNSATSLWYHS